MEQNFILLNRTIFFLVVFMIAGCNQDPSVVTTTSRLDNSIIEVKYFHGNELDSSFVFFDGKKLEEKYYYPTGEIKQYLFYSIAGERCYYREYDVEGGLKAVEGEPCFYGASNNYKDTTDLTTNDTIKTYFFAPTIPDCATKFFVVIEDSLYPYVYKMKDIGCGYYTIKDPYEEGLWEVCFAMSFNDSISKYSIRKNKCVIFRVKGL